MISWLHRSKTLEQLENFDWGEPEPDSYFDARLYRLRRKRINKLTPEELKLFIDWGVGLLYLIPVALKQLERNPLEGAGRPAGHLLASVLYIDVCFWVEFSELWHVADGILDRVQTIDPTIYEQILPLAEWMNQRIKP